MQISCLTSEHPRRCSRTRRACDVKIERLGARLRPGFFRHDLRSGRLRRDEHGRGLRRLSNALSALAVRHGVRTAHQGLRYGLQKIYEMVINNDPCYAYLLRVQPCVDQKLVMAHVYGHCDFFKNNYLVLQDQSKNDGQMANHANRIRKYMDRLASKRSRHSSTPACRSRT